ncbi:13384_t:CDS:2 [Entrophospora sp. SA101]|nr:13384_t:CDS:2 [Entrophospora sp. SA101]
MNESPIHKVLKNTPYGLNIFDPEKVGQLENKIVWKNQNPYVVCLIRNKEILLKPEEIVRQLYIATLMEDYNYPKSRIKLEHSIHFGREKKSADIVIFDKDRPTVEYIIIEVKKPNEKLGKEQLKSYCNATDPNYFEEITSIPNSEQSLSDVLRERYTLKDLIIRDKIPNEGRSLKQIILSLEDEVLANAGVDVFEEEITVKDYLNNFDNDSDFRVLEFRNTGQSDTELKAKIQRLFDSAKRA